MKILNGEELGVPGISTIHGITLDHILTRHDANNKTSATMWHLRFYIESFHIIAHVGIVVTLIDRFGDLGCQTMDKCNF